MTIIKYMWHLVHTLSCVSFWISDLLVPYRNSGSCQLGFHSDSGLFPFASFTFGALPRPLWNVHDWLSDYWVVTICILHSVAMQDLHYDWLVTSCGKSMWTISLKEVNMAHIDFYSRGLIRIYTIIIYASFLYIIYVIIALNQVSSPLSFLLLLSCGGRELCHHQHLQ